ncbi:MAG: protein-L-isoaspartate(D-aspartate) O-methyltransferase [Verrucomicrobia bacterium]|nr:protein-L-isoaspartate(D-aspartate) O-methyltransferase [Verrucomicrobiota bacterium]
MRWQAAPCALACLVVAGCSSPSEPDASVSQNDRFADVREKMVKEQLTSPGRDISDERVLSAMATVPRHEFVPEAYKHQAYEDHPLPIGFGQTISQPFVVAFMSEQLRPLETNRVLEIGTGSGYQAAVLSSLVKDVYSVEIIEALGDRARETLQRLGYDNVHVRIGDGFEGWPEFAPFDLIIVTCAPEQVPDPLVEQLKEGGRMIIPVGTEGSQFLYVLEKRSDRVERKAVLPVRFVPMTGGGKR